MAQGEADLHLRNQIFAKMSIYNLQQIDVVARLDGQEPIWWVM